MIGMDVRVPRPDFELEEATIAEVHAAMTAGRLTAVVLVKAYLANDPVATRIWLDSLRRLAAGIADDRYFVLGGVQRQQCQLEPRRNAPVMHLGEQPERPGGGRKGLLL